MALWMHLESLESTQEARIALGYRLEQLLRFCRALHFPRASITGYTRSKHEIIRSLFFFSCSIGVGLRKADDNRIISQRTSRVRT